jgi:hypothetical protein
MAADGKTQLKEIVVKKGTNIFISIIGSNRNKNVWGEDADEWKPDRWINPMPQQPEGARFPGVYNQMFVLYFLTYYHKNYHKKLMISHLG